MKIRGIVHTFLVGALGTAWACSSDQGPPASDTAPADASGEPSAGSDAGLAPGAAGATAAASGDGGAGGERDGAAGAATDAGEGGASQDPIGACASDDDCDDGKICNGVESCVDGACEAGPAVECEGGKSCSDTARGACRFTDPSPWIVYQADDEKPGRQELFALKRDLAGTMDPIKISRALKPGSQAYFGAWTPDPSLYVYTESGSADDATSLAFVYFDERGPQEPTIIAGEDLQWAPSGRYFYVTEAHGVSIYENQGRGKLTRVAQELDLGASGFRGRWSKNEELFYSLVGADGTSSIYVIRRENSRWSAAVMIVDGIKDLSSFMPSPDGRTVAYDIDMADGKPSVLYQIESRFGSDRKFPSLRGGPHSLSWSADGSRFLLIRSQASKTFAWMGTGDPYYDPYERVAGEEQVVDGSFGPDGTHVILAEPLEDGGVDVRVLGDDGASTVRSLGRIPSAGGGLFWSSNGDTGLLPIVKAPGASVDLSLVSLSGRPSKIVDSIAPGERFEQYEITPRGEFVAYSKGSAPNLDGAYVDLRYGGAPKPIRLPGSGSVADVHFDDTGLGLFYRREESTGASGCYYLDLSHQVAAAPVKIGRDGRVAACAPQPSE